MKQVIVLVLLSVSLGTRLKFRRETNEKPFLLLGNVEGKDSFTEERVADLLVLDGYERTGISGEAAKNWILDRRIKDKCSKNIVILSGYAKDSKNSKDFDTCRRFAVYAKDKKFGGILLEYDEGGEMDKEWLINCADKISEFKGNLLVGVRMKGTLLNNDYKETFARMSKTVNFYVFNVTSIGSYEDSIVTLSKSGVAFSKIIVEVSKDTGIDNLSSDLMGLSIEGDLKDNTVEYKSVKALVTPKRGKPLQVQNESTKIDTNKEIKKINMEINEKIKNELAKANSAEKSQENSSESKESQPPKEEPKVEQPKQEEKPVQKVEQKVEQPKAADSSGDQFSKMTVIHLENSKMDKFNLCGVPAYLADILIYNAVDPRTGECKLSDGYNDTVKLVEKDGICGNVPIEDKESIKGNFYTLKKLKERYGITILLEIGGGRYSTEISSILNSSTDQKDRFINSCTELIKRYEGVFDGLSLEIESAEQSKLTRTVADLRENLSGKTKDKKLAIRLSKTVKLDFEKLNAMVDFFFLGVYDCDSDRERYTGHFSPLSKVENDPEERINCNIEDKLKVIKENKGDISKTFLEVYTFARQTRIKTSSVSDAFNQISGDRTEVNRDRIEAVSKRETVKFDHSAAQEYVVDEKEKVFLSFDGPKALTAKKKFIEVNGMRGIVFRNASFDSLKMDMLREYSYKRIK